MHSLRHRVAKLAFICGLPLLCTGCVPIILVHPIPPKKIPAKPSVAQLRQRVQMGMTWPKATQAAGGGNGGTSGGDGRLVWWGSDGSLLVTFTRNRVTNITALPPHRPQSFEEMKAKIRLGMKLTDVFRSVGTPDMGCEERIENDVLAHGKYTYSGTDQMMRVIVTNGLVADVQSAP